MTRILSNYTWSKRILNDYTNFKYFIELNLKQKNINDDTNFTDFIELHLKQKNIKWWHEFYQITLEAKEY
jgi:hypothetical protein